jgi:predicted CoA-substrate-specific enzyme activase
MPYFMGIDIGSGSSKAVITENGKLLAYHLLPSGINYRTVSQQLRDELLDKTGLSSGDVACIVATGQGSANVPFSDQEITDIRCCARGINSVFPSVRTVIDVQGQSSQVIRLNEKGQVVNFVISEKCAAGSGRFIDVIANVLQLELEDIGSLSLK